MELIGERHGEAKQQETFQFIVEMLPIWRENMARYKKKKAAKRAKRKELAAQVAAMQLPEERAAVVAEMTPWEATWEAEHPVGLQTPSSHMVSRPGARADGSQEGERAGATHAAWWP
jgi:hypothetical protein